MHCRGAVRFTFLAKKQTTILGLHYPGFLIINDCNLSLSLAVKAVGLYESGPE